MNQLLTYETNEVLNNLSVWLEEVEELLAQWGGSSVTVLKQASDYLMKAGGKRFRPMLVLLSSYLFSPVLSKKAVKLAAGLELIHTATLVHDDLIDRAEQRRGKKTVHLEFGRDLSIIIGDYLFTVAFAKLSKLNCARLIFQVSSVTAETCEGEALEIVNTYNVNLTEDVYLEIIRKKTASLVSVCCRGAAILAGASRKEEELLADFGLNVGIAYQIKDDLLDLETDNVELGKTTAKDLREGKLTLPVIYALQMTKKKDNQHLIALLEKGKDLTFKEIEEIISIVYKVKAIERASKALEKYIKKAQESLDIFKGTKAQYALIELSQYMLSRKK